MKVLIAEDSPVTARVLEGYLASWGYEVVVTRDGFEALTALRRPDAPLLAILDWMMPKLDGPAVCRQIRMGGGEPYTYILLLTGKQRVQDLVEGLDAGADDYVSKPFNPHELRVRLRAGTRIVQLQKELLRTREELRFQATHDALTGAKNRHGLDAALESELLSARETGTEFVVAMIDLDHFKKVNDTHGHATGDAVLEECAARMRSVLRPRDFLGRYGGEEFIVALPGCSLASAATVAERLRAAIGSSPIDTLGKRLEVTCSVGIASSAATSNIRDLVARADAALYQAKSCGRNRVSVARCTPASSLRAMT